MPLFARYWFVWLLTFAWVLPALAADTQLSLQAQVTQAQEQHQMLLRTQETLQAQSALLQTTPLLFQVLQEQRSLLREPEVSQALAGQLAEARLHLYALSRVQPSGTELAQWEAALAAAQIQVDLLSQRVHYQQENARLNRQLIQQINQQLIWAPSHSRLNLQTLLSWPESIRQQLQHWQGLALTLPHLGSLLISVVIAWLALGLWLATPYIKQKFAELQALVGHEAVDLPLSPWTTPSALSLLAIKSLPGPLLLVSLGVFFASTLAGGQAVTAGLIAVALCWFVLSLMHQVLQPQGIAERHFAWAETERVRYLRFTRLLAWALIPSSFLLAMAEHQAALYQDLTTPLVLVVFSGFLAVIIVDLFRHTAPLYQSRFLHTLVAFLLLLLPASLLLLTVNGYVYTGLKLTSHLLASFYLLLAWVLTEATVNRSLRLRTERLRYQLSHAQPLLLVDAEEQTDVTPLPAVDVDQAHQQSQRLSRFLMLMVFGGALYFVWQPLLAGLSQLDAWVLWEYVTEDSLLPISFADLISALFILGLTLFLAANLPGLLEMLVLSRLQMQQGSGYAIKTLLNYVIVAVGFVLTLSALGVSWSKLQWLVAALSVGLGFGLQEIFANFVSGLILLFERPIRIGDVVTLNNLSGRVSRIRIRATTITDFDRKDIIVPNKNFITGQLINWSLTDTVTRVIVKVGVAYGSDLNKVREILLEAAQQSERVLKDPAPQVLFLSFGDSTLDHELRIHVGQLSDRNPSIDEINRYIDRRFKEEGIEIAFRQLDVHLRNSEGVERLVLSQPQAKPD